MARLIKKIRQSGFTLVEMLIVVAIIGILATLGIPTFKRMVQKSKKTEAKVMLGGIYTAEQAFLAEYQAYGNNLVGVGAEMDNLAGASYLAGFMTTACANPAAILPVATGAIGKDITRRLATYYTGTAVYRVGFTALAKNCYDAARILAMKQTNPGGTADTITPSVANVYANPATADSNRFIAVAAAVVSPQFSKTAPAAVTDVDIWAINGERNILNTNDGVR